MNGAFSRGRRSRCGLKARGRLRSRVCRGRVVGWGSCGVVADARVYDGAGVAGVEAATAHHHHAGVGASAHGPRLAVRVELRFEGSLGGARRVPVEQFRVRCVVTVAEHPLGGEPLVGVRDDVRRLHGLEFVDHHLAGIDRLFPACGVVRAAHGDLAGTRVERRVLVPRLSAGDVRGVRQEAELVVQPLHNVQVVGVVERVVPDPQDPICAHVLLDHRPVEVVRGGRFEAVAHGRDVEEVHEFVHARVAARLAFALFRDGVPPAVVLAEVAPSLPGVRAASAQLVRMVRAPLVPVAFHHRVRHVDAFAPYVARQPREARPRGGVAPVAKHLERDGLAEDAAYLAVVEAEVFYPVHGEVVLVFVGVHGDVRDAVRVPGGPGGLSDDGELHLAEAGRIAARDVYHHEIVGVGVRVADGVVVPTVRPAILPVEIGISELVAADGEPVLVAVRAEYVHGQVAVVHGGVRSTRVEVLVAGVRVVAGNGLGVGGAHVVDDRGGGVDVLNGAGGKE